MESLATQTLVLFVIRTAGRPWASRPSRALALGVVGVAAASGCSCPSRRWRRGSASFRCHRLFFAFVVVMTIAYLGAVEIAKRRFYREPSG